MFRFKPLFFRESVAVIIIAHILFQFFLSILSSPFFVFTARSLREDEIFCWVSV